MSTTDEEKIEGSEAAETVEATTEEVSVSTEGDDSKATSEAETSTADEAVESVPEAPDKPPVAPVEEAAASHADSDSHQEAHGHSETHFPMDDNEEFDRQLVTKYTPGGHEYDPPMAKGLMIFTGALAVLVVLCGIGILQMFKAEKNAMLMEQAARIPKDLSKKRGQNAAELTIARPAPGRNTITVTVDEAKSDLVANPSKLKAFVNPPQPPRPAPTAGVKK